MREGPLEKPIIERGVRQAYNLIGRINKLKVVVMTALLKHVLAAMAVWNLSVTPAPSAPLAKQTPPTVQSDAQGPALIIQAIQNRSVSEYVPNSLMSGQMDPAEVTRLKADAERLWKAYSLTGAPYDDPGFLPWWRRTELDKLSLSHLYGLRMMTMDRWMHAGLLQYVSERGKDDPNFMETFLGHWITNDNALHLISASVLWVLNALVYGFAIGFAVQVFGGIVKASLQTVVGQLEGKALVLGTKLLRRPAVWLRHHLNRGNGAFFDHNGSDADILPSYEIDGLELAGQTRADMDENLQMLKKVWSWCIQVKQAQFTPEMIEGRESLTRNIEGRENHLAFILSTYMGEVNSYELSVQQRADRIALLLPKAESRMAVLNLLERLQQLNEQAWKSRPRPWDPPETMGVEFKTVVQTLMDHGAHKNDLEYFLAKSNAKIMAEERIAATLALQTIQDISYPEYNRAQTRQIRALQKAFRVEYNFRPIYMKYRDQVVKVLRNTGFKVSAVPNSSVIEFEAIRDSEDAPLRFIEEPTAVSAECEEALLKEAL